MVKELLRINQWGHEMLSTSLMNIATGRYRDVLVQSQLALLSQQSLWLSLLLMLRQMILVFKKEWGTRRCRNSHGQAARGAGNILLRMEDITSEP
ncbi:MAG: hypothetical protein A4E64_00648 [Syntrophorhabdus sp. PtaU1.Bin058]|nr:MAG: hypothetical protein A4E64_00648 [Syntrophorhabdus sp. PtaU1.Bin058]